jgi:hypothetical protein
VSTSMTPWTLHKARRSVRHFSSLLSKHPSPLNFFSPVFRPLPFTNHGPLERRLLLRPLPYWRPP